MFRFEARIYPIIDTLGRPDRSYEELAAEVLAAGAPLIQLRTKHVATRLLVELGTAIQKLAEARGSRLLINDRADVALAVGAAGVHLGQGDLPPEDARRLLGPDRIIG